MFTAEFSNLDGVIESLKQALPPLEPNGSQLLPLIIHSLAQVATIQLHNPFCLKHDHSRSCAISAAMAVVEFVRQTNLGDVKYIDAIVGVSVSLFLSGWSHERMAVDLVDGRVPGAYHRVVTG
jgi:hypothetical protein